MLKSNSSRTKNLANKPPKKLEKFFVWIIGCQQNEHDGARISYMLENLGLRETEADSADLIIILACSVRQTAVDRIYGRIKNWPDKKIITTGCVLSNDKKKLKERNVEFWDIEKPEQLAKILHFNKEQIKRFLEEGKKLSSSVCIMFGCNNFCSYCATPYTRGRERSRNIESIVKEVKALITLGKKEILLLGQNVNSYKDPLTDSGFKDLLKNLNNLKGDFVIAFTSNHPKDMTDGIIEAVANLPKIKKEIHLPIQSGSNKILKAMRRPYTREKYLRIIEKIRNIDPKIDITTDVIIGFPGETDKDFEQTVDVFKKVGYKMAYINKYSPRVGTAAYKLGDPISWKEKQRRWHELDKILSLTRS